MRRYPGSRDKRYATKEARDATLVRNMRLRAWGIANNRLACVMTPAAYFNWRGLERLAWNRYAAANMTMLELTGTAWA